MQTRRTDATVLERRRAAELIARATPLMRDPAEVMRPERLGSVRLARFSFARSFIRQAARQRWRVDRPVWELDAEGRGEAIYTVRTRERPLHFVAFSDVIPEEERTDRVIADRWDVTAVLCEGTLDRARLEEMRREVPRQEDGRADPGSLVWTRANRSSRFFKYTVAALAAGESPDAVVDAGYIVRGTAFYANGKWGTTPFQALSPSHPVGVSYRAQMLANWLLRELSYDLAEHCARARNPRARRLGGGWRRFLGIGNATGLGLVPFIINHPRILNAWCTLRELSLALAKLAVPRPADPEVGRLLGLLERAVGYFRERAEWKTAPFMPNDELATELALAREVVAEFARGGTMLGAPPARPWETLSRWAGSELSLEGQELLHTLLVELYDDLDGELEATLAVDESETAGPMRLAAEIRSAIEHGYAWALGIDFADPAATRFFWYYSASSEEPRRGVRGLEPGEQLEMPIDVARQVQRLHRDLEQVEDGTSVAAFLLEHPEHRGIVERVQSLRDQPYGEVRSNLLEASFRPLDLQRFQLAMYGMESFNPQSTDWLRVTLFQGAPRAEDVAAGLEDDWIFPPKP